jgi:hypothetical protein
MASGRLRGRTSTAGAGSRPQNHYCAIVRALNDNPRTIRLNTSDEFRHSLLQVVGRGLFSVLNLDHSAEVVITEYHHAPLLREVLI